jgi:hypothetical protein
MSKKGALTFFLLLTIFFLFCASGYIDTIDATPSVATAKSLLENGNLIVDVPSPDRTVYFRSQSSDGKKVWLSKMGLLFPVLYYPMVVAGRSLSLVLNLPEDYLIGFFVSLVNSLITALIALCLFYFFTKRGFEHKTAMGLAALAVTATLLFPYAKTCQREPLQALLILCAFVGLYSSRETYSIVSLSFSGLFAGLAILAKPSSAVALVPLMFLLKPFLRANRLAAFLVPFCVVFGTQLLFNSIYTGDFLSFGYSQDTTRLNGLAWKTPLLTGVWKQLFSSDTGLLFWNPILLLLPFLFLKSKWKLWDTTVTFSILLMVLFHARWWSPVGDRSLGPRYLVGILPLFFLFLSPERLSLYSKRFRPLGIVIALTAVALQIPHVTVKAQQYHEMRRISSNELSTPHWLANIKLFLHKLHQEEERYEAKLFGANDDSVIQLKSSRSLQGFNFWWSHLTRLERYSPGPLRVSADLLAPDQRH